MRKPKRPKRTRHGKPCARVTFNDPLTGERREWCQVTRTKDAARDLEHEWRALLRLGIYTRERQAPEIPAAIAGTFRAVAIAYRDAAAVAPVYENRVKLSGLADWKGVRNVIEHVLIPALGDRVIAEITHAELVRFRDARIAAPKLRPVRVKAKDAIEGRQAKMIETDGRRSIARINREMSVLRQIFSYAVDARAIDHNPTVGHRGKPLVILRAERPRERVLTIDEERALLKAYDAQELQRKEGARQGSRDVIVVLLDSGMRVGEVLRLVRRDVDLEAAVVRIPWEITKTKRPRTVPLSKRTREIFTRRCAGLAADVRPFADLSYQIVRDDFTAARTAAGIVGFRLHDARATVATRLLEVGVSEVEIARMTGHTIKTSATSAATAPTLRKHYLRAGEKSIPRLADALDSIGTNDVN